MIETKQDKQVKAFANDLRLSFEISGDIVYEVKADGYDFKEIFSKQCHRYAEQKRQKFQWDAGL